MNYAQLKSYKVRELVESLLLCLLCNYMDVFACKPQFLLTFCVVIRCMCRRVLNWPTSLCYLTQKRKFYVKSNTVCYSVRVCIFVTVTVITVGVNTVTVAVTSKSKIVVRVIKACKGRRGVAPLILNHGTG